MMMINDVTDSKFLNDDRTALSSCCANFFGRKISEDRSVL